MRVWPIIIDSQPAFVRGTWRSASLLFVPFGPQVLLQHVAATLRLLTTNAPIIVAPAGADSRYSEWVREACPSAHVVTTAEQFAATMSSHELSDALLFVDPRRTPLDVGDYSQLIREHAREPRVSLHLVAFERADAGTKERVSFDPAGQVRGIQRYYENATWPFIAGVSATLAPCSCGLVAGGELPRSLFELRQSLIGQGVPSRDLPIAGGSWDLSDERGVLAANEQLVRAVVAGAAERDGQAGPHFVGEGQSIGAGARVMGPVVLHKGVTIEPGATVLGPSVIGAGARISADAVVAHGVVGPDCTVPPGTVVRDRTWFKTAEEARFGGSETRPQAYSERLARLAMEAEHDAGFTEPDATAAPRHARAKRALDIVACTIGLLIASPVLILIAVAVWLESGRPIFYGDKREGWRGRVFECWKFRTMFTGAHLAQRELKGLDQTDGPHFKVDRDPRVTRVGRVLRALNVDELPQLFNVLIGEMSLVGPRPSPFRENQVCVPWRAARLSVRPGITGFWQVCRHDRAAGDFHQWIEYDLLYVQHQSLTLDLKILSATALTLGGKLAHVPAAWLVSGGRERPVRNVPPAEEVPHDTQQVA